MSPQQIVFLLISLIFSFFPIAVSSTSLDDYVWKKDPVYSWTRFLTPEKTFSGEINGKKWTGYTLNYTSQQWLTDDVFSPNSDTKSIWWHYLVVIIPENVAWTRNGTLYITGGWNTGTPPSAEDEDVILAATLSIGASMITGTLFNVPNEHAIFKDDPIQKDRSEDSMIAYTWDHFLKDPSQPEWLLYFPMTKAAVYAMDAVKEFVQQEFPELQTSLDYFCVAGASKRGWTTWLTAAVDQNRVKGAIPIVLDLINFVEFAHHQYRSYNGWTWALKDYTDMNIMTRLEDPNMVKLQELIDPHFYRDRLTLPKLVVNAVLDEFQMPDDTHYWWNDMPEPKAFLMTPNAEHSETTGLLEIVPVISTWIVYLLNEHPVPSFTWTINNSTGEIIATLDDLGDVHHAYVWYATSCGVNNNDGSFRRDFRIENLDSACECGKLNPQDNRCLNLKSFWDKEKLTMQIVKDPNHPAKFVRQFSAVIPPPTDGRWGAFLIDITYEKPEPAKNDKLGGLPKDLPGRLQFTTEVSIVPNSFPFVDCTGATCNGNLV